MFAPLAFVSNVYFYSKDAGPWWLLSKLCTEVCETFMRRKLEMTFCDKIH